ncbi:MAG TPA: exodeoxyribonuclease VII large subunit [Terriglobales bacterium]|jgi:exodeoxyribonuclease VII large subunit|nr:exodeoxyribonuclease VII large subunit [Terriglobales bacterium]
MATSDQLGFHFRPPERRIWTVRALVSAVRAHIEREYSDCWVEGEISNLRIPDSGHLYFTLKEEAAQVRVVMFRSSAKLLRFRPENGLHVTVRGRITVYEDRGELQISAEFMEPQGAGALQLAFEQLKARLQAEGLFETSRKKPIPPLPQRIGIITSPQGAALRDILNILERRHHSANVLIYPAQVQGDAAPSEVMAGLRHFNQESRLRQARASAVEVIIIARGGGSAEDLACFNHEGLARAVAESKIPVISAIGHETDFTIIDFVADLRAPTPSAAAELVIRSRQEIEAQAEELYRRLERAVRYRLLMARQDLHQHAQHGAFARMMDGIRRRQQKLDEQRFRLEKAQRQLLQRCHRRCENVSAAIRHYDARRRLASVRQQLDAQTANLTATMRARLLAGRSTIDRQRASLEALSPVAILNRGYALVFDANNQLVKDAAQLKTGEEISARLARGQVRARVTATEPGETESGGSR